MYKKPRTIRSSFSELEGGSPLGNLLYSTVEEWFLAKHRRASEAEVGLINSLVPDRCPHCGSPAVIRYGKRKDGVRVYACKSCGRRFNPLTGTVFDSRKIPLSEWVEFLIHVVQFQSVLCSSLDNQNAYNTGRYWMRKLFAVLEGYQDGIELSGKVWVDETFLSRKKGDLVMLDGLKMRGISRNQHCIYCATDGKSAVLLPRGMGHPTGKGQLETVVPHMAGATLLVDDADPSHGAIEEALGIPRKSYPGRLTKGMDDSENPLRPINSLHREFKRLMAAHGGFDRNNIIGYCNLASFMFAHRGDKAAMVMDLLEMSIACKKVLRYRETLQKRQL